MPIDFTKMQDITLGERLVWEDYRRLIDLGTEDSIQQANNLIDVYNLQYKVHNAFNWNRLVNAISDKTATANPTNESIEGQWNNDFNSLKERSGEFENKGTWANNINYKKNNLVQYQNIAYICVSDNIGNVPTASVAFWNLVCEPMDSLGLKVLTTPSSDLKTNDLYFLIK